MLRDPWVRLESAVTRVKRLNEAHGVNLIVEALVCLQEKTWSRLIYENGVPVHMPWVIRQKPEDTCQE